MKKTILAALAFCLAATLASADVGAKLYMGGSLDDNLGNGLILNNQDQQYNTPGMVHLWADGKNAGFSFSLYTGGLSDASVVSVQKVSAWFRPLPTVKVTLGGVGLYSYTEQINWWKDPTGASLAKKEYSNNIGSDSSPAAALEFTGVPNLTLSAIAAPGYGLGLTAPGYANLKVGGSAKYDIKDKGSLAVGLRYDGMGKPASIHAGFDLNAVPGLYTFLDLVARNDNNLRPGLDGLAFDWFGKYSLKTFTLQASIPVVLRLTGLAGDVNYFSYDVKVSYDFPSVKITPYAQAQQDFLSLETVALRPQVNVGASFNGFDSSTLDCAFQFNTVDSTWSIPFSLNISF